MTEATQDDSAPSHERLLPGGNAPPLEERLPIDYAADLEAVDAVAARATAAPKAIEADDDLAILSAIVKDSRSLGKQLEAKRVAEKTPFDNASKTVHTFFKARQDRLETIVTAMDKRIKTYLDAKAAAERAARQAEADRQRAAEAQKRAEAEEQLRLAAEAQRAAQKEAADRAAAEQAQRAADAPAPVRVSAPPAVNSDVHETRMVDAAVAFAASAGHASEARAAERGAAAKPADLARTRTDAGLATLQTFVDFEVVDWDAVSLVKLRAFIKQEHVEQAIRVFVKTHGMTQTLPGVRIFENTRSNVR